MAIPHSCEDSNRAPHQHNKGNKDFPFTLHVRQLPNRLDAIPGAIVLGNIIVTRQKGPERSSVRLKAWGMTDWLRRPPVLFSADPGHALRRRVFASHGIGNARSDLCAGIFGGRAHGLRLGGSARGAAGGSAIERDADFAAKLIY